MIRNPVRMERPRSVGRIDFGAPSQERRLLGAAYSVNAAAYMLPSPHHSASPFFRMHSLFIAASAAAASSRPGSCRGRARNLSKGSSDAVHAIGPNGKRFVFLPPKPISAGSPVSTTSKTLSNDSLSAIPGGNVTYRPGIRLVKVTTDLSVCAVAGGGILR